MPTVDVYNTEKKKELCGVTPVDCRKSMICIAETIFRAYHVEVSDFAGHAVA